MAVGHPRHADAAHARRRARVARRRRGRVPRRPRRSARRDERDRRAGTRDDDLEPRRVRDVRVSRQRQGRRLEPGRHADEPHREQPRLLGRRGTVTEPFNVYGDDWESEEQRPGYRRRGTAIGPRSGAQKLGMSLYELPPGEKSFPYHYEIGCEEWLIVVAGRPTLR